MRQHGRLIIIIIEKNTLLVNVTIQINLHHATDDVINYLLLISKVQFDKISSTSKTINDLRDS